MSLIIEPSISINEQKKLVNNFNKYIKNIRDSTYSLCLPNYRDSTDIGRKRISFDLVYKIIGHLID